MDILQQAQENTKAAWAVLRTLGAVSAWELALAEVKVVGSLACGLYYNSHDLDLHVYTDTPDPQAGFEAMGRIAAVPGVKNITYTNLLAKPDACCEWHASYTDPQGQDWTLDIIHMARGSRYDGYFEKQAAAVKNLLTEQTRRAILEIKKAQAGQAHISGIWIYAAVLRDGVRTPQEFATWYAKQDTNQILHWPLSLPQETI